MVTKYIDVALRANGAKTGIDSLSKKMVGLGSDSDKTAKDIKNLDGEVTGLQSSNKELSATMTNAARSLSKAGAESDKLAKSQEKAAEAAAKLKNREVESAHALALAIEKSADLSSATANTEKQQASLDARREKSTAKINEMLNRHELLAESIKKSSVQSELMSKRQKELTDTMDKASKEVSESETQYDRSTASLEKHKKKLASLEAQEKRSIASSKKVAKSIASISKVALGVAVAVAAAGSALTAMTVASARNNRELTNMARLVGVSVDEFTALAHATTQYGINAERISDISKDVQEKVSEFAAAGTGTFQDYADVMKLTKEQAAATALEFEKMSGAQVLGVMVSRMEAAGVSAGKMSFAMESVGNDATKLIPLFANNGAELIRLTQGFNALNQQLSLTSIEVKDLSRVSETFDLMNSTATKASTAISASLAPAVEELLRITAEGIPDATAAIIDFINAFKDVDEVNSIASLERQLLSMQARLLELRNSDKWVDVLLEGSDLARENLEKTEAKIADIVARLEELRGIEAAAPQISPEDTVVSAGTSVKDDTLEKQRVAKLDALFTEFEDERNAIVNHLQQVSDIRGGFKTAEIVAEEVRNTAQVEAQLARRAAALELTKNDFIAQQDIKAEYDLLAQTTEAEHQQKLTDIATDAASKRNELEQANNNKLIGIGVNLGTSLLSSAISNNAKTEKEKKRARKKSVIIDTAAGISLAFATNDFATAVPIAASIAATGLTNLAAISSASGSVSSVASATTASTSTSATSTAETVQQAPRTIELIGFDSGALIPINQVREIMKLAVGDDDVLIDLNNAQQQAARLGVTG